MFSAGEVLGLIKNNWAVLTGIAAAITFLLTFFKSIFEYTRENSLKRFEKYQEMTREWNDDDDIQEICRLLEEENSSALRTYDAKKKRDFVEHYEDVAVMYESGLMRRSIAFYMFGYYAIRCFESEDFRVGIEMESSYYALFRRFAKEMAQIEQDVKSGRDDPEKWKFKF
jgi:hypothetical protein